MRSSKQLLLDSRLFAKDDRRRSWWVLLSTMALLAALIAVCVADLHWAIRVGASLISGLTLVRLFIIYHDYQHGTILKGSRIAGALMTLYGLATLNAPSIWARSHDHHHKNNAKVFGAAIGSYPVMTTTSWARASRGQRVAYLIQRHPLTILAGYLTIFLYGMTIRSLINNPREHWDSAVSLMVHFGLIGLTTYFIGPDVMLLAVVGPCTFASAIGGYLFYAQHNYPAMKIRDRANWDYVYAAIHSSSYIPMNPVSAWFTGNIGFHHVHHLNFRIPFYNLPQAMAAFEELQNPGGTTLWPWDIVRCLKLKLWDAKLDRLISLAEYRRNQEAAAKQSLSTSATPGQPVAAKAVAIKPGATSTKDSKSGDTVAA